MLVLTRKHGQSVVVKFGDRTVVLTVGETRDGRTKLLFDAPKDVAINRYELEAERCKQ